MLGGNGRYSARFSPENAFSPRSFGAAGDEHGDLPVGPLLVLRVGRVGGHGSLPPGGALGSRDLSDSSLEGFGAVLDRDLAGIGLEVVVPDGILRRAPFGRDQSVLTVVLDTHERDLADL